RRIVGNFFNEDERPSLLDRDLADAVDRLARHRAPEPIAVDQRVDDHDLGIETPPRCDPPEVEHQLAEIRYAGRDVELLHTDHEARPRDTRVALPGLGEILHRTRIETVEAHALSD